jgi:uncharacterized membrane protein YtjA (UPF0391 family)
MLGMSILFLIVALAAAMLGFGLIAGASFLLAKILFFVFLVLFVISLVAGARTPRDVV